MFTEKTVTIEDQITDAKRQISLRLLQLQSAAITRGFGEIDADELDGFAARYAAAVRELNVLHQFQTQTRNALSESYRGKTWIQS